MCLLRVRYQTSTPCDRGALHVGYTAELDIRQPPTSRTLSVDDLQLPLFEPYHLGQICQREGDVYGRGVLDSHERISDLIGSECERGLMVVDQSWGDRETGRTGMVSPAVQDLQRGWLYGTEWWPVVANWSPVPVKPVRPNTSTFHKAPKHM